jgi:hypothetical protein
LLIHVLYVTGIIGIMAVFTAPGTTVVNYSKHTIDFRTFSSQRSFVHEVLLSDFDHSKIGLLNTRRSLAMTNADSTYQTPEQTKGDSRNIPLGAGLLTAEYIILPAIAYKSWWKEGFIWDNPLDYVGEKEPFLADNTWHLAGCNMLTEFHYRIMNGCFRSRHSVILSTSLTLLTFTAVECLDALEKTGKWEFSMGDMFANVLGVGFWTFKHYNPDAPVSIRVGIRKWGDVADLLEEAATAITDFSKFQAGDFDHYAILKVEGIYRFKPGIYCGFALSRKDAPSDDNLWGITVGWDLVKGLNRNENRKSILHTISEYVSIPVSFTYWLD